MASSLKLEIITPDKLVFSGMVDEVTLPGVEGELGILPDHLPLLTNLASGRLEVKQNGETLLFAVHSGFAQVLGGEINVLTDAAEASSDIDIEKQRAAIAEAEKNLQALDKLRAENIEEEDPSDLHRIALERARARLFVAEESGKKK